MIIAAKLQKWRAYAAAEARTERDLMHFEPALSLLRSSLSSLFLLRFVHLQGRQLRIQHAAVKAQPAAGDVVDQARRATSTAGDSLLADLSCCVKRRALLNSTSVAHRHLLATSRRRMWS